MMSRPIIGNNIPIIPAPMEININFQKIILSFSSIIVGGCVNNKTKKIIHAIHIRIEKSRVIAWRVFIFLQRTTLILLEMHRCARSQLCLVQSFENHHIRNIFVERVEVKHFPFIDLNSTYSIKYIKNQKCHSFYLKCRRILKLINV